MKNLLSVIFLSLFLALGVNAQVTNMNVADTVTNAGVKSCSIKVTKPYKTVSIQVSIAKISGTVGGSVIVYGSLDNVNYVAVDTFALVGNTNSYTPTDVAAQSKIFIVSGSPYYWYKVTYTGTGTMSAQMKCFILPKE